jgi:hypothetical protein
MSSTRVLADVRHFWNQQLRLHQLYLDRHDVSGRDAVDALARRKTPNPEPRTVTEPASR